jgi:hypothetical protein
VPVAEDRRLKHARRLDREVLRQTLVQGRAPRFEPVERQRDRHVVQPLDEQRALDHADGVDAPPFQKLRPRLDAGVAEFVRAPQLR